MTSCPNCWSIHIDRSHRKSYERLLSFFGVFPFHCNECGRRFHSRYNPKPSHNT